MPELVKGNPAFDKFRERSWIDTSSEIWVASNQTNTRSNHHRKSETTNCRQSVDGNPRTYFLARKTTDWEITLTHAVYALW